MCPCTGGLQQKFKALSCMNEMFKGAGSRNVNNLLWKRRFCSIFDSPYHRDFPLLFSKYRSYFEDGLLNFVEKQSKHSYVVGLQRYKGTIACVGLSLSCP